MGSMVAGFHYEKTRLRFETDKETFIEIFLETTAAFINTNKIVGIKALKLLNFHMSKKKNKVKQMIEAESKSYS